MDDLILNLIYLKIQLILTKNLPDKFDYYNINYKPLIKIRPKYNFTYGTDHKNSLLKKAKKLNFYDKLLLSDLSKENKTLKMKVRFSLLQ